MVLLAFAIATIIAIVEWAIGSLGKGKSDIIVASQSAPLSSSESPKQADASVTKIEPLAPRGVKPQFQGITVRPYDLYQNPFKHQSELVAMNLNSRPVLYNGTVVQYAGPIDPRVAAGLGLMALKFNHMMGPNEALYDLNGLNAGAGGGSEVLGQMLVETPSGEGDLDLAQVWIVEPAGQTEGTNGFGATITVPTVRFVRYLSAADAEADTGPATQQNQLRSAQAKSQVPWQRNCDPKELQNVRMFYSELTTTLNAGDLTAVAPDLAFPLHVNSQTPTMRHLIMDNAEAFKADPSTAFTPAVMENLKRVQVNGCVTFDPNADHWSLDEGRTWVAKRQDQTIGLEEINE